MAARVRNVPGGDTHKMRFAARLRDLREARGFSAARHFAEVLGIRENRYTRYERGASEPDIELIHTFCDKLGVSPNELFGYEPAPSPVSAQPGFSSGPQSEFAGTPLPRSGPAGASGDVASGAVRASPAPAFSGYTADAPTQAAHLPAAKPPAANQSPAERAAWRLASQFARLGSSKVEDGSGKPPLSTLIETARIYQELSVSPYGTVAQMVTDLNLRDLPSEAARVIEAAVQDLIDALGPPAS